VERHIKKSNHKKRRFGKKLEKKEILFDNLTSLFRAAMAERGPEQNRPNHLGEGSWNQEVVTRNPTLLWIGNVEMDSKSRVSSSTARESCWKE